MPKKLEFQTFLDLTQNNQIKVSLYILGALILLMIGVSGISAGLGGVVLALLGAGGGGLLGYTGYKILVDPKNEKKCNAAYWTVTELVGFDPDDYNSDLGITLCKAQLKAQYDGKYMGFYCASNTATVDTVDAFYIPSSDSKKFTLRASGTSNVFTVKTGDNKVSVTEPLGSFTVSFKTSPTSSSIDSVTIVGSGFTRIDETRNALVSVLLSTSPPSSPQSSQVPVSVSIEQLKSSAGVTLTNGPFTPGTVFTVTAYSTTRDGLAVSKTLRM